MRTLALRAAPLLFTVALASGCGTPPPPSQLPTARAGLDRLKSTGQCGLGVHAQAKVDQFGAGTRVRGDVLLYAVRPARVRLDAVSPFGVTLATLASDGARFTAYDIREKQFFAGPAEACAIARVTGVPIPGHALVSLLMGQAPVLKHEPSGATVEWSSKGYYRLRIASTRGAEQELLLAPHPGDFEKPWQEQRMRLVGVTVRQGGQILYTAELDGHAAAKMAAPREDPDGIDPPLPTSGPPCAAEVPLRIHLEIPGTDQDTLFKFSNVEWNPPLPEGVFTQPVPGGMKVSPFDCR